MAENAFNHKIVWTVHDNIVGNNVEINAAKYDIVALVLNDYIKTDLKQCACEYVVIFETVLD